MVLEDAWAHSLIALSHTVGFVPNPQGFLQGTSDNALHRGDWAASQTR